MQLKLLLPLAKTNRELTQTTTDWYIRVKFSTMTKHTCVIIYFFTALAWLAYFCAINIYAKSKVHKCRLFGSISIIVYFHWLVMAQDVELAQFFLSSTDYISLHNSDTRCWFLNASLVSFMHLLCSLSTSYVATWTLIPNHLLSLVSRSWSQL